MSGAVGCFAPNSEESMMRAKRVAVAALAAVSCAGLAFAQNAAEEIEKYRQALQDGNPAELWEARGEGAVEAGRAARTRCRSSAATSASGRAWSRARTRSCRATSPTPIA